MALRLDHLQQREEHWAIVDLFGNGDRIRTVPVPDWVRSELDGWLAAAAIDRGRLLRRVDKSTDVGNGMTVKAVWHIVKESPDLLEWRSWRRTICGGPVLGSATHREASWGGFQFLLGHVSVQTTERYLGCKQRIRSAVNDRIGIEPTP